MADRRSVVLDGRGVVRGVFTDRADGDFAIGSGASTQPQLARRRAELAPLPWTWLEQVHGADVVLVGEPGEGAGRQADAAVTQCAAATLSVQVADCAPVLLFSPTGDGAVVAAAHAGWKGLLAGVIEATVAHMKEAGATDIGYWVGPCISPAAYEFAERDLDALASRFGDEVRGVTSDARPALDMRAAVDAAVKRAGVGNERSGPPSACTALSESHWSHRRSSDLQRQVGAIWWEADPGVLQP
ncbi:MAG: laccase domain-containing protein [Microthrixaceae bacterium]